MNNEIWKFLRDLNIYAHNFMNCNLTFTYDGDMIRVLWDEIRPYVAESIILNKKFWFIKWLVENEKIDFHIWNWEKYLEHPIWSSNYDKVRDYEDIIQWLSVEDEPIKFLCEILK